MKKDVLINIHGEQGGPGQISSEADLATEGRLYQKGDAWYLLYKESDVTGMAGTSTTIKVHGPAVTMTRAGSYPSMMAFEAGRRHTGHYSTDFGELDITVITRRLKADVGEDRFRLEIAYDLELQHAYLSSNSFTLEAHERQGLSPEVQ